MIGAAYPLPPPFPTKCDKTSPCVIDLWQFLPHPTSTLTTPIPYSSSFLWYGAGIRQTGEQERQGWRGARERR